MKKATKIKFLANGEERRFNWRRLGPIMRNELNLRTNEVLRNNPNATTIEVEVGDLLHSTNKFVIELTDAESELLRQAVKFVLGAAQLDVNEKETLIDTAERLKAHEDQLLKSPIGTSA